MIRPEVLNIYVRLCETLSFTKTAEALNIPKSTVSDSIKRLEEVFGVSLIKRTTRKVLITDEGHLFYEKAQQILSEIVELGSLFSSEDKGKLHGRVRIDMPISLARNLILPKLSEFLALYPDLDIEISSTDRKVDLIAEGFDFVIRVGKMKDSSLIAKKVGEYSMINCVGKKYIERYGLPKNLKTLEKHYQIHYLQNLGVGHDGLEYFDGQKYKLFKTKSLLTVNNTISYVEACLAGFGIIQVPAVGVSQYIETGELVEVLKKYQAEPMTINLVYPNRERVPKRVKVFMDWCEEKLRDYIGYK